MNNKIHSVFLTLHGMMMVLRLGAGAFSELTQSYIKIDLLGSVFRGRLKLLL